MAKFADQAIGAISGFLFQFEQALLSLSALQKDECITVEAVDDIAVQKLGGPILVSMQAKHSMSCNSSFRGNSKDVWRTLQIWVEKLNSEIFTKDTKFICISNVPVSTTSILHKLSGINDKEKILLLINPIRAELEQSPSNVNNQKIKDIIDFIITNIGLFAIVCQNLTIKKVENLKEQIISNCNCDINSYTQYQLDSIYEELYGWFIERCQSYWKQNTDASFTKSIFSQKLTSILRGKHNAKLVFRAQDNVKSGITTDLLSGARDRIFCKQLADLFENPDAATPILEQAIDDLLCSEIEIVKIIDDGVHTKSDFEEFKARCLKECLRRFSLKYNRNSSSYSEVEKNEMAKHLYEAIIEQIQIPFDKSFNFTYENKYVQNGTIYQLTDMPTFGWHIDWKSKYKSDETD